MITIGITGTAGSGKGTVADYLVTKYGFKHYSARAFISEELDRRGLVKTRENIRLVANELRATNGPGYIISELYERAIKNKVNAVLESIRNPSEIDTLRQKPGKFFMLAVDADPKIRYERIVKRKSSTDFVGFEKFMADEQAEMNDLNPSGMKIAQCIKMSDALITNDADLETFLDKIDKLIQPLLK